MRVNAEKIVRFTSDLEYREFLANEPIGDLVIRKIENMGEAARYIRELFPDLYESTSLPWRELIQMRNRLTHGYFDTLKIVLWGDGA